MERGLALTRVEGEGEVVVHVDEKGIARRVEYRFTEAPRFFEYIVKGVHYTQVPDLISRICGLCGVSYILCASRAFENCLDLEVPDSVEAYRELVYLAERVKSHVIHVFLMNLPDLLGVESLVAVEKENPTVFNRVARLLSAVDRLMKLVGGRLHNVVNICVGGVYGSPAKLDAIEKLVSEEVLPLLESLAGFVLELVKPTCGGVFPKTCTVAGREYPGSGFEVEVAGQRYRADEFYERVLEVIQKPGDSTLRYRFMGECYVTGPIARFNAYRNLLLNETKNLLEKYGWYKPLDSVYHSAVTRVAEAYDALLRILNIAREVHEVKPHRVSETRAPGSKRWCFHVIEAPRGVLYQGFELDSTGFVTRANIVTPTAQNVEAAEEVASHLVAGLPVEKAVEVAKKAIVPFDPCISCSVHALGVRVLRS